METKNLIQLWRVEIVNRKGYEAPSLLIESKTKKDVHIKIKKLNLRLLDFPELWSYRIINLNKKLKNGKWI